MRIINPATEQVIEELKEDNSESIQSKLQTLRQGQIEWGKKPLKDRVACLIKFSDLLQKNIESLSQTLTSEVGKPLQQSRNEINGATSRIHWLTENAEKYLSDEVMGTNDTMTEKIVYEPLGVVCNISAWNYPYLVGINVFVPALMAGNAVMYKPSEHASLTGLEIQRLLIE
ncbi:MAG TPA: aldehyde dehydrogenase family protein, partial [Cyclobacteriaceae bacterium]|nr:aldehyde dehydrogenase family protein [Cyclobacteriaceae bacterium]